MTTSLTVATEVSAQMLPNASNTANHIADINKMVTDVGFIQTIINWIMNLI